jgi:hypothetical protein
VAAPPAVNAKSLHAVNGFRQTGQLRPRERCLVRWSFPTPRASSAASSPPSAESCARR